MKLAHNKPSWLKGYWDYYRFRLRFWLYKYPTVYIED